MTPLSVLDLSPVSAGSTEAAALHETVEVARRAEELGYHRFWLAEHHGGEMVASSAPEIMIDRVANATERIRVGSGGIMLPNHTPLHVAEQFKVLEALHPGRIDLGIGRAPGTDQLTAMALRRGGGGSDPEDLPARLGELFAFAGERPWPEGHPFSPVRAAPAGVSLPPVYLLGSSDYSAILAAATGLGFAFAAHINPGPAAEVMRLYRDRFEPSDAFSEPSAIIATGAICAESDDEAHRVAAPARVAFRRLRAGRPTPLPSIEDALTEDRRPAPPSGSDRFPRIFVGDPESVAAGLRDLVERSAADELMVMTNTHGLPERLRSFELLAAALA